MATSCESDISQNKNSLKVIISPTQTQGGFLYSNVHDISTASFSSPSRIQIITQLPFE